MAARRITPPPRPRADELLAALRTRVQAFQDTRSTLSWSLIDAADRADAEGNAEHFSLLTDARGLLLKLNADADRIVRLVGDLLDEVQPGDAWLRRQLDSLGGGG